MKILYLAIIGAVAIGFVGTSYAIVTHADQVDILGNMNIINANMETVRADGFDTGNGLRNTGGANIFQFWDVDNNQVNRLILTEDGSEFDFFDVTHARKDIVIKTASGNVGIGNQVDPQEKLDVLGNIKLSGNIVSNGDICIGACP